MGRIFISYGHDRHAALAQRLKEDLEAAGRQVWFDLDRLKPGGDWAAYIAEALDWISQEVDTSWLVLLMTPHSVRRADRYDAPAGFCLNELTRALERRIRVLPVMVEDCEPPLSICRLQYLDMRDGANLPAQEATYRRKLAELNEALDGVRKLDFQGVLGRLGGLLEPLSFSEPEKHLSHFVGRAWLAGRVEHWLADPAGEPLFWITGDPGVGKTALSAYLCSLQPVAGYHFCAHGEERTTDARRCVKSLSYQLASQLPSYRDLLNALDLEKVTTGSPLSVMRALLIQPLKQVAPPLRPLAFLVDGLDEASADGANELADLLATCLSELPAWLRVIVTSRPESPVTLPLQRYRPLSLERTSADNEKDLIEYVDRHLAPFSPDGRVPAAVIESILERSEGLFLYLHHLRLELAANRLSFVRPEEFPKGMGEVYWRFFRRHFPDPRAYQEKVRPVLEIILSAAERLQVDLLAAIFDWTDYEQAALAGLLGPLFPVNDGRVQVVHKTIAEWLVDPQAAGPFVVSPREGHRRLAAFGYAAFEAKQITAAYLLAHLPRHLRAAGRTNELKRVLRDWSYAIARCAAGLGSQVVSDHDALGRAEIAGEEPLFTAFIEVCRYASAFLKGNRPEVIARLELAAHQVGLEEVAQRLASEEPSRPWSVQWTRFRTITPHQIVADGGSGELQQAIVNGAPALVVAGRGFGGGVRTWEIASGRPLGPELKGHDVTVHDDPSGGLRCLAIGSSEGRTVIVSGGDDRRVRSWDPRHLPELQQSADLGNRVRALAWAELDGRPVVVAWSGEEVHFLHHRKLTPVAEPYRLGVAPVRNGALTTFGGVPILVCLDPDGGVRSFDLARRCVLFPIVATSGDGGTIAVASVAEQLVVSVGSNDGRIHTHSPGDTATSWPTLETTAGTVTALFLGEMEGVPVLVAGTYENQVLLWRLDTGAPAAPPLEGHTTTVTSLLLTEDGGRPALFSGDLGGTVRRWSLGHQNRMRDIRLLEGARRLATGRTGDQNVLLVGQRGRVTACDLRTGDDVCAAPTQDRVAPIWLAMPPGPDCRMLAGYWGGGLVISRGLQDGTEWTPACNFPFNLNAVEYAEIEGRGSLVGAGSDSGDSFITRYDLVEGRFPLPREAMPHDGVDAVCVLEREGTFWLWSLGGGRLRKWRLSSGEQVAEVEIPGTAFVTPRLAQVRLGSRTALVVGAGGRLQAFDADEGAPLSNPVPAHSSHIQVVRSIRMGDQDVVASAGWDGWVRLWDPRTWSPVLEVDVDDVIQDLAFDQDVLAIAAARGAFALRLDLQQLARGLAPKRRRQ